MTSLSECAKNERNLKLAVAKIGLWVCPILSSRRVLTRWTARVSRIAGAVKAGSTKR